MSSEASATNRARLIERAALAICLLWIAVWVIDVLSLGIRAGLDFDGPYADGPFQILNPLRRLAAGQVAGRDFQFFHGIYVPLLHYPFFALFGKSLAASEFTRRVLSPFLTYATFLIGCRWITGRWKSAFLLATASLAILDVTPFRVILYAYNSVLPVRTFAPLLAIAAFALPVAPLRAGVMAGILAGASLLIGSEQGTALLAGGLVAGVLEFLPGGRREARRAFLAALVATPITAALLLVLATHGDLAAVRAILVYNFRELPSDQFWFFGADPQPSLIHWSQLFHEPYPLVALVLCGVAVAVALRVRWRLRAGAAERSVRLADAGLMLLVYGTGSLGSLLALYIPKNVATCYRSLILFALGGLYFAAKHGVEGRWARLLRPQVGQGAVAVLAVALLCNVTPYPSTPATLASFTTLPGQAIRLLQQGTPGISPSWGEELKSFSAVAQRFPHSTVWSTYAGFPEYIANIFHPDTDYIIHALGLKRRQEYVAAFDRVQPDLVQTERLGRFRFEEWLEVTWWPFYERVLLNYVPAQLSPNSIIWRKRAPTEPAPTFSSPLPLAVGPDGTIDVPLPQQTSSRLAVVRLKYKAGVTHPWLPMARQITHYEVQVDGAQNRGRVPLNPATNEVSFPLRFEPGDSPVLRVSAEGLWPGGFIHVDAADISFVEASEAYQPFILGSKRPQESASQE